MRQTFLNTNIQRVKTHHGFGSTRQKCEEEQPLLHHSPKYTGKVFVLHGILVPICRKHGAGGQKFVWNRKMSEGLGGPKNVPLKAEAWQVCLMAGKTKPKWTTSERNPSMTTSNVTSRLWRRITSGALTEILLFHLLRLSCETRLS